MNSIILSLIKSTPKLTLIFLIKFYQKTLSLDHGILKIFKPFGQCRFRPTCSDYALEAINKYGAAKGGWLAAKRLYRCHPWAQGGWDPLK